MATNLESAEKELLRRSVLECVVARHPAALTVAGIARRVRMELDFAVSEDEVVSALRLLGDLGLVKVEVDELGSTAYWRATAQGVLAVERRGESQI